MITGVPVAKSVKRWSVKLEGSSSIPSGGEKLLKCKRDFIAHKHSLSPSHLSGISKSLLKRT